LCNGIIVQIGSDIIDVNTSAEINSGVIKNLVISNVCRGDFAADPAASAGASGAGCAVAAYYRIYNRGFGAVI